jgi:hypothetical protein
MGNCSFNKDKGKSGDVEEGKNNLIIFKYFSI